MRIPMIYICPYLLFLALLFHRSGAEVGTAAIYSPPYLPTACYGSDPSMIPGDRMFAAAGDGIWDDGDACGREYRVRCLSAPGLNNACVPGGEFVHVRIVDQAATSASRPSDSSAVLVLNVYAFQSIAAPAASLVNVEFLES